MARVTQDAAPRSFEKKTMYLGEIKAGSTIIVRPISKAKKKFPFNYPAYKPDYKEEGKMLDGYAVFNLTAGLNDQITPRPPAENAMLEIFQAELDRLEKRLAKLGQKLKQNSIDRWGPNFGQNDYAQFGMAVVEHGNVAVLDMYSTHYKAVYDAMRLAKNGKLVFTPLICSLEVTMAEQAGKKTCKAQVQVVEPQAGCMNLLPASFIGCTYAHPDDFQIVQEYVTKSLEAAMWGKETPEAPVYRDYPNDEGKIYFIATESLQEPVWMNVFEKGFPEALLPKLRDKSELWQYLPASQHSLLGGYYYDGDDGTRQPVTLEQIKANFLRSEEGKAVINLNGQERVIGYIKGSLNDKKFNPYLVDTKAARSMFSDPDIIAEHAKRLGIPVKGDQDPVAIVEWDSFLAQTSTEPSRRAPVASM